MEKQKRFLDTVHGYISIPETYCDRIIDTPIFQRLRRIEQTSSRSIFPCARHDRFIHSLGVYHIGSKIFKQIRGRCCENFSLSPNDWRKIKITYQIACLLHDCGHAPFSHTFEYCYDKSVKLFDILNKVADDTQFSNDFGDQADSAPHERLSSILVLQYYKKVIEELEGDPLLVVRMIIGCKYLEEDSDYKKIANCFISLLNGNIIDADKLDYVCRDKWASGYSSNNVDIERLISAIHLKNEPDGLTICYDKSALYEIQSVIDIKNFQQLWVYSHHKVLYDQYILDKAIETMAIQITGEQDKEIALGKLFNYETFTKPIKVGNHKIYLPSDDDLIHLLKQDLNNNKYAQEWFGRTHHLIPLWKSKAEFFSYFGEIMPHDKLLNPNGWLFKSSKPTVEKFLKENGQEETDYLYKPTEPKFTIISNNEINIDIDGEIRCFTTLGLPTNNIDIKLFFYIYIPKELEEKKSTLIKMFQDKLKKMKK